MILKPTGQICEIRVENNTVGTFSMDTYGGGTNFELVNNYSVDISGNPYGIARVLTAQMPYNPTVYHCKYGPVGQDSYTP